MLKLAQVWVQGRKIETPGQFSHSKKLTGSGVVELLSKAIFIALPGRLQIISFKMIEVVEVIALFLGFSSWILILVSLQDQYWKESTTEGSVITTSTIYENLWMSCASDSTGIYNCRDFPSLFALPGKKNAMQSTSDSSLSLLLIFHLILIIQIKYINSQIHFIGDMLGIHFQDQLVRIKQDYYDLLKWWLLMYYVKLMCDVVII